MRRKGDPIGLFAMDVAINRMGGVLRAGGKLGASREAVATWLAPSRRVRPKDEVLSRIAELSGVSRESLFDYYKAREAYREKFGSLRR